MSEAEDGTRHISAADYLAWLERAQPRLAEELTAALPQEARDAGLRFEWVLDPDELRNVFPRWHSGKVCYALPSGNMVHVKPGCRC